MSDNHFFFRDMNALAKYLSERAMEARDNAMKQSTIKQARYFEGIGSGFDLAVEIIRNSSFDSKMKTERKEIFL